jgi:hypothetical protein
MYICFSARKEEKDNRIGYTLAITPLRSPVIYAELAEVLVYQPVNQRSYGYWHNYGKSYLSL